MWKWLNWGGAKDNYKQKHLAGIYNWGQGDSLKHMIEPLDEAKQG